MIPLIFICDENNQEYTILTKQRMNEKEFEDIKDYLLYNAEQRIKYNSKILKVCIQEAKQIIKEEDNIEISIVEIVKLLYNSEKTEKVEPLKSDSQAEVENLF